MEEDWTAMESGATAESHAGGGTTIVASLSPHMLASADNNKRSPLRAGSCALAAEQ